MASSEKPDLYVHVEAATHFLRWELPELSKYFTLVDAPSEQTILFSFGPDVLNDASRLPARKRFAVTFPGFSINPLRDLEIRKQHLELFTHFDAVFINPGPLEIAYANAPNIEFYPFSVDMDLVKFKKYRTRISSLLHISNDQPVKDWERSQKIMELTGLLHEVFPPRNPEFLQSHVHKGAQRNRIRRKLHLPEKKYLPYGYVDHKIIVRKYQTYDGFVHIASDVQHPTLIDGKYTASLIEAGVTGAILFWHDTFGLGNGLETVFDLPEDPEVAAKEILEISRSIDVKKHSKKTREEMMDTFNVHNSIGIRAQSILEKL